MTVSVMLASMPSSELTEWIAFYDLRANPPKKPQTVAELRDAFAALAAKSQKG